MTDTATKPGTDTIAALRRTIEEQRRTIDALIVAADRRTTAEPDNAALATWQHNMTADVSVVIQWERARLVPAGRSGDRHGLLSIDPPLRRRAVTACADRANKSSAPEDETQGHGPGQ